jgi:hypothetical protein
MDQSALKAAQEAAKAAKDASDIAWQHFEKAADSAVECAKNTTPECSEHPFKELTDAASEANDSTLEHYRTLLKYKFMQAGMEAEEAEKWVESRWKEIVDKAKQIRGARDAARKATKVVHRVKVAFVTAVVGFFTFAFVYQKTQNMQHGDAKSGLEADQARWRAEQEFQHQMENFNSITTSLEAPDVDVPRTADPTIAMQAAEPNIEIMPPAVQAIAIQPVEITVTMPTEQGEQTKTVTTTIGQVWTHGDIHTREEIQRKAEDPQTEPYKYAFQDPNSCTVKHCMEGGGGIHTGGKWDGRAGPGGLQTEQH